MSTRCQIHFVHDTDEKRYPSIYRHSDGYPDGQHGVLASLERFFKAVKTQTHDTRFGDPEYLAAKFVVWQSGEWVGSGGPLDFLSVGVANGLHGDEDYEYRVICDTRERTPTIQYRAIGARKWTNG